MNEELDIDPTLFQEEAERAAQERTVLAEKEKVQQQAEQAATAPAPTKEDEPEPEEDFTS